VLVLRVRGRRRRLGGRRRLRSSAEASQKVGAARARSCNRILGDGGHFGRRGQAKAFQGGTLASRSETRGGHANAALGLVVVVCHLSKTASVHAHCGVLERKKVAKRKWRCNKEDARSTTWKKDRKWKKRISGMNQGGFRRPIEESDGRRWMTRRKGRIYKAVAQG
jgi:hypothetical protein